ncbi:MAG TPA: cupin domain-containing protein [Blastocatellia bacterium]|nr:cupin domain-containing protein [Blastocatellia bacterium]
MIVKNRDQANVIHTRHGSELRPLIDRTTCEITRCSLAEEILPPGAAVTPHHHQELEEIYYILSGAGVMTVGDESLAVGAGDAIYVPRNCMHSLDNTGSGPIRLLVACGPAFYYEDEILDCGRINP